MSEDNTTTNGVDESAQTDDAEQQADQPTDWEAEATKLREELAKARKWEQRAKENRGAVERLAELERAQMSETEKAEARVREAEKRANELEAANARKDVAIEFRLDVDDAALLDDLTDPDAMRRLAGRLKAANDAAASPRSPRPDKSQGRDGDAVVSPEDAFIAFTRN